MSPLLVATNRFCACTLAAIRMIAPAQATLPDEGHAARMEDLDFDVIGSLQARKLAIEIEGCFSRCTANFLMFMSAYFFTSVNRHVEDTTLRLSWLWNCCYFANRNPFIYSPFQNPVNPPILHLGWQYCPPTGKG
jgi:hypothetical protein